MESLNHLKKYVQGDAEITTPFVQLTVPLKAKLISNNIWSIHQLSSLNILEMLDLIGIRTFDIACIRKILIQVEKLRAYENNFQNEAVLQRIYFK